MPSRRARRRPTQDDPVPRAGRGRGQAEKPPLRQFQVDARSGSAAHGASASPERGGCPRTRAKPCLCAPRGEPARSLVGRHQKMRPAPVSALSFIATPVAPTPPCAAPACGPACRKPLQLRPSGHVGPRIGGGVEPPARPLQRPDGHWRRHWCNKRGVEVPASAGGPGRGPSISADGRPAVSRVAAGGGGAQGSQGARAAPRRTCSQSAAPRTALFEPPAASRASLWPALARWPTVNLVVACFPASASARAQQIARHRLSDSGRLP